MSRANFVQVQLAAAATDTQTTLSVKAPVGGFKAPPADGGRLVLTDSPGRPTAFEVITYTGRTGTGPYTLTGVTRGLEGTVGLVWGIDTFAMMTLTVAEFDVAIQAAIDGLTAADIPALDASKITTGVLAAARIPTLNQDTTGSAARLTTARTINGTSFNGTADITTQKWGTSRSLVFTGDVSGGASVDGSTAVAFAMTLANSGVTAGTYPKVTVDAKGRVTGGAALSASDIPSLDASKIVSGTLNAARIPTLNQNTTGSAGILGRKDTRGVEATPGEYEDGVSYHFKYNATTGFTAGGGTYHRLLNLDAWAGTSGGLSSQLAFGDNGTVGIRTATSDTVWGPWHTFYTTANKPTAADVGLGNVDNTADNAKSVLSAAKLATARTIGGVSFDGSANINLPGVNVTGNQNTTGSAASLTTARSITATGDGSWTVSFNGSANVSAAFTLASTGVVAGTYPKVTVDAKGRVTAGAALVAGDLPSHTHSASNITSGVLDPARLPAEALVGDTTYSAGVGLSLSGTIFSIAPATADNPGGVRLGSDVEQTVAPVAVTSSASRTYAVQMNADQRLVVNVPWSNTTYSEISEAEITTGTASTARAISARRLTFALSSKADVGHTHAYLPLAGGTMTGAITFAAGQTWPTFNQDTTGNAGSATALANARTLTIGDTGKSFDGSANVTWTLGEIGAAPASHTHSYLPLSGGTVTGIVTFSNTQASTSATTGAIRVAGGVGVGGSVYASGNVSAYSDISLKTNIQVIPDALDKVCSMRGVTFDRVDMQLRQTGVIAQEVQAVLPEAVTDDGELLSVAYGNMVGLLIEAIKELRAEVNELRGRV